MAEKIRYTVRLYRLHDLELITFAIAHQFNIIGAMYASLHAFAKGETFVFQIPPRKTDSLPALKRVYIKVLTLDAEKDKDAVEILSRIVPGCRNSFLKNLLRMYLCSPLSEEYFRETKKDRDTGQVLYETPISDIMNINHVFEQKFGIFKNQKPSMEIPLMPEKEYRNQYTKKYTDEELLEREKRIQKCRQKAAEKAAERAKARERREEELKERLENAKQAAIEKQKLEEYQEDTSEKNTNLHTETIKMNEPHLEKNENEYNLQAYETDEQKTEEAPVHDTVQADKKDEESAVQDLKDSSPSFTGMENLENLDPDSVTSLFSEMAGMV